MSETRDPQPRKQAMRPLVIEFLFLDRLECGRCRGTEEVLDRVVERLRPVLETLAVAPSIRKVHVTSAEQALAVALKASPTVRIEGRDIQPDIALSRCEECGTLCGCTEGVDCRMWLWEGDTSAIMPAALFTTAVLQAVCVPTVGSSQPADLADEPAALSEPLRLYFSADRSRGSEACCTGQTECRTDNCC